MNTKARTMKFTESHEWIKVDGEVAVVGVTDYAQSELGDIVYVELPEVGSVVKAGDDIVVLESTKAAADVYTPVTGEIVEVNVALSDASEEINKDPQGNGWLFKIKLKDTAELDKLMDLPAYKKFTA
jgi:glycine cleavage system H protein